MKVYYNENDPRACAWLKELIHERQIPDGDIDSRSIRDVCPEDLCGYLQCHFFAGIGGWAYALKLAGWPESRPVWTGSCPCQPFSVAGQRRGYKDSRHLFPTWLRIIAESARSHGFPTIFGEQVASKDGRIWFDGVRASLETLGLGYIVGGADLCAAGVGAPHIRQRLFWVAESMQSGRSPRRTESGNGQVAGSGGIGRMADPNMPDEHKRSSSREQPVCDEHKECGFGMGNASGPGLQERVRNRQIQPETLEPSKGQAFKRGSNTDFWSDSTWIQCLDGKQRRIESESQPMDDGVSSCLDALRASGSSQIEIQTALSTFPLAKVFPGRIALLRGYGNAIVAQVAAEFISAFLHLKFQPKF